MFLKFELKNIFTKKNWTKIVSFQISYHYDIHLNFNLKNNWVARGKAAQKRSDGKVIY